MRLFGTTVVGNKHMLSLYTTAETLDQPVEVMLGVYRVDRQALIMKTASIVVDSRAEPFMGRGIRFGQHCYEEILGINNSNYTESFVPIFIDNDKAWKLVYKVDRMTNQISIRLVSGYYGEEKEEYEHQDLESVATENYYDL